MSKEYTFFINYASVNSISFLSSVRRTECTM